MNGELHQSQPESGLTPLRCIDRKYKRINNNLLIFAFLFLLVFISKANIINLPYHWDEAGTYIAPTHWLAQGSLLKVFPGFRDPYTFFGHPPALYLSLAIIYKIFGETIWISHLFAITFSFLGVYFTYLLANYLCNSRIAGISAALFLFFTPLYFAQSGMVLGDIPVTAFGVMTVYYMLKRKYLVYLLCSLYLVMLKESSVGIIAAILCYLYYVQRNDKNVVKDIFKYSVPLFVIFGFFLLQKITTGMILPNPFFNSHPIIKWFTTPRSMLNKAYVVGARCIFGYQGRMFLSILILLTFAIKKNVWKKEFLLFLLIFIFFIGVFTFIYFIPRYILPTLPYFCILGAYAVVSLIKNVKKQILISIFILVMFIGNFYGKNIGYGNFENDMQYMDIVSLHKKTCKYIEEKFFHKRVLALWPLSQMLSAPYLGYVEKPIKVVSIDEEFDIMLYPTQRYPKNVKLDELIKRKNLIFLKRFEKNGKSVEIYGFLIDKSL